MAVGSVVMVTMNMVANVSQMISQYFPNQEYFKTESFSKLAPETKCPTGQFKCDDQVCLPNSKKCDRIADCRDGSDERGCRKCLLKTQF